MRKSAINSNKKQYPHDIETSDALEQAVRAAEMSCAEEDEDIQWEIPFSETGDGYSFFARWAWNPFPASYDECPYCDEGDDCCKAIRNAFFAPQNSRVLKPIQGFPGNCTVLVAPKVDLFGEKSSHASTRMIIRVCAETPQWHYAFLTRNPKRLREFTFPPNAWAGVVVDTLSMIEPTIINLPKVSAPRTFIWVPRLNEEVISDSFKEIVSIIIYAGNSLSRTNPVFWGNCGGLNISTSQKLTRLAGRVSQNLR
jgi:hypothetical protein